jgi:hypothetical protein
MKWLCDICDVKYDINVICYHRWPCDKNSILIGICVCCEGLVPVQAAVSLSCRVC